MKLIIFLLLLPLFGHTQLLTNPLLPVLKYEWRKISGPSQFRIESPASAVTEITNLEAGVYQFELKVTNSHGLSARDTMVLTVNPLLNKMDTRVIGKTTKAVRRLKQRRSLSLAKHI
ncbi:MAG TPA: hypothetical protein VET23_06645 [Chitinophagaceae bacterium]|nr:hypothetical protein [Chitinophagaceae bacterium]